MSPAASAVSMKTDRELLIEQQDNILIIKINRPHTKNALNRKAIYELIAAIENATNNGHIKLIIITGVGDFFTAGVDLKQVQEYKQPEDYYRGANFILRYLIMTILSCTKLLVCLVNGPCIGIGFTLAALCDAVYCTRNAYFQANFSQLGICAESCSSWTFPRHFGSSWSTKLLIFGEQVTACKAEQLGFVLEVFDNNSEVQQKFWSKMKEYANLPAESLRVTKKLIKSHDEEQLKRAMYAELKEMEKLRNSPFYKQAIQKFIQKSLNVNKSKL